MRRAGDCVVTRPFGILTERLLVLVCYGCRWFCANEVLPHKCRYFEIVGFAAVARLGEDIVLAEIQAGQTVGDRHVGHEHIESVAPICMRPDLRVDGNEISGSSARVRCGLAGREPPKPVAITVTRSSSPRS